MYLEYFGLSEKPFNVTCDPSFFFFSRRHKEAIACMSYGIQERKGIIMVTGEIGIGKTTMCRSLLSQLDKSVKTALVLNPYFSEVQLLEFIVQDFGIKAQKRSRLSFVNELNKFLLEESALGNNAVIIIDEAQNLSCRQLEQIRLLSNLETDKEKLLQIILVGQPELRDKLNLFQLRQLKQRVMVDYHIEPLDEFELGDYISHRLGIACGDNPKTIGFTDEAVKEICQFSQRVPRLINLICDRALLLGFIKEKNIIGEDIIRECVKDIRFDGSTTLTTGGSTARFTAGGSACPEQSRRTVLANQR